VGRHKRKRREQKQHIDTNIPHLFPKQQKKRQVADKFCTLCGKKGHYAPTCHKPDPLLIVKGTEGHRKHISRTRPFGQGNIDDSSQGY